MKNLILILAAILLLVSGCASDIADDIETPPQVVDVQSPGGGGPQGSTANNIDPPPQDIDVQSPGGGSQGSAAEYFPHPFDTADVYGNAVTDALLAGKELYFIHLWATWCPPCIAEMPDLARLSADYSDRVGFLALLDDFDNAQGAVKIYDSAEMPASFITIDAHIDAMRALLNMTNSGYIPTTIILDRDGNMLGEQLIGAKFYDAYASIFNEYLN